MKSISSIKNKNKLFNNLYKKMLKIRMVEESIAHYYHEQEMRCPVHLSIGQEAVAAGVCENLNITDKIISTHRSHAHYLAKGGNLKKMLAELYGKNTGCVKGLGGSMHLQDYPKGIISSVPIVGSTIPIGVGVSLATNLKKRINKNITVIFFGEGATEEGVFHESINFAGIHDLPILFICENNLYSVYTSMQPRQSKKRDIVKIAESNGIKSEYGDGNNVLEVYSLVKKNIEYIKKYSKPVLLEFSTYRWLEHCGPNWDDDLGYRKKNELKKWIKKCPIKHFEKNYYKENKNKKKINNLIQKEIIQAYRFAKKSKFPNSNIIDKYIYSK